MKKSIHLHDRLRNDMMAFVCCVAAAAGVLLLLYQTGLPVYGNALYAQVYKLDIVAESLGRGFYLPLYADEWYNGYEIFRYSPNGAYLLLVLLSRLCQGNLYLSICCFHGAMAFVSTMGFMLFGIRYHKKLFAFLAAIVYLLLPSTSYIVVSQGSFDMTMALAIMPSIFFFLCDFIDWNRRMALLPFSVSLCILVFANYIFAVAFGSVMLLYLFLHAISVRSWKFEAAAACNLLIAYMTMGYFLVPAVSGGLLERSYFVQGNDVLPVSSGMVVITMLGLITTDRKRFTGFFITIMIAVLSLQVLEPVRRLITLPVLQRTYWYLPIITVIFLATLLSWERLRPLVLAVMFTAIAAESIFSLMNRQEFGDTAAKEEALVTDYLLEEAVNCTDNKVALVDNASLGAFPHWYFVQHGINDMYGWDYENAMTVRGLMSLNEAFADGFYDYLFDRLLLYGSDTAIIVKERFSEEGAYEVLLAAAKRNGYELMAESEKAALFKAAAVNGTYGVTTQYENLAIGENAYYIAYIYPSFGYGRSDCLEDYTVEELQNYRKLYLAGFTYREKEKAENMLKELSDKGTEVYIDMQHIPVNILTGKNEFMGTYAQFVQFTEDFPILQNDNGNQFKLDFKTGSYETWDTVYISGCEEILKETAYDNESHLIYLGQNHDPNVTFMGFNLVYYYLTTHDQDLKRFLDEAMQLSSEDLHQPVIVPIQIEETALERIVHVQEDNVNCNIASVDTLQADRIVSTQEDLFVVNQGTTTFRISYPDRTAGILVSVCGIAVLGVLWIAVYVLLETERAR